MIRYGSQFYHMKLLMRLHINLLLLWQHELQIPHTNNAINVKKADLLKKDSIFIDLQKAFDTLNHDLLIKKLNWYGLRGLSDQWVKSYLSDRKQYVNIENSQSKRLSIHCGVPQGSILGPKFVYTVHY